MGHSWALTYYQCIPNLLFGMNEVYCNWPFMLHTHFQYIGNQLHSQYIGNHNSQFIGNDLNCQFMGNIFGTFMSHDILVLQFPMCSQFIIWNEWGILQLAIHAPYTIPIYWELISFPIYLSQYPIYWE